MKILGKYEGLTSLALLLVVVPLLVWQYAVSDTVKQWRTTTKSRQQIEQLRSSQSQSDDRYKMPILETEMILSGLIVAELLPLIEVEGLRIERFAQYITSEADGVMLTTGMLSVQGGFIGIVKLLAKLENDMPGCEIIATHYRSIKPRNRNITKTLSCMIYIQQITTVN